jgi:hypothetical protein
MMNIPPPASLPSSPEECVKNYLKRLRADKAPPFPHISFLLTAFMAWPNDESRRDSWMATNIGRLIQDPGSVRAAYSHIASGKFTTGQGGTAHEHRLGRPLKALEGCGLPCSHHLSS